MMVSSICIWLCGITGGIVAKFINKFITDRKMTTLILVFIAILTIARKAIVMQLNWLKIILVYCVYNNSWWSEYVREKRR